MEPVRIGEAAEWEHFVSRSFYALSMNSAADRFTAVARVAPLSRGVRLAEVATSGMTELRRTRALLSSDPSDELLFLIQLAGRANIEQADRLLVLEAGQATFCDPGVPYSINTSGHQFVAMVPRHEVLPGRAGASDIRLRPLSLTLAPLRVFRLLAEEMTSDPGSDYDLEATSVAGAATELLRSAAVLAATSRVDVRSWSHETQLRTVKEYLLARLMDPTLRMEQVAVDNRLTVRQLSAIFAPDDSPAAFLRRERLRRARSELTDPRFARVPVADIGARWGFPNPSTFGRAFRKAFGLTPIEARTSPPAHGTYST